MKRLSLEELKAQKKTVVNLESIKGGNLDGCHVQQPVCVPVTVIKVQ